MYPQTHFLMPFFIALIFSKLEFISWRLALLAGIIGVLIDADHYIEHIILAKKDKFSFKKTWNNSVRTHRFHQRSFIHHWQGLLILTLVMLFLLFYNWQISLILAIGYYSHLGLDFIHLNKPHYLRFKVGKLFVTETYFELGLDLLLILGIVVLLV